MTPMLRDLPDPERAKPCVLVIDDDEAVAWAIAGRLGRDFRVVGVSDPSQAVTLARELRPGVILCDISMPRMTGDEVAFALSQDIATAQIPFVYLTALVSPEEGMELDAVFGDHPAVSKSATTEELREVIAWALGIDDD
ncbi:response regulator [Ramlibacter sp. G-1-2-2]|uniref:Response regulator n=2 Tax=Ramlibacter agri TaxID=2728837 RepID=A0A848HGL1_9BURK|nr:response regulator [Ramlibacter agri]